MTSATEQELLLLELVDEVVGDALVGAYRHGSATLGGSRPDSDVDVLAVTRRSLDSGERGALVRGLLKQSAPPGADGPSPLELTVVVRDDVQPWRFPPLRDFQWGEWLRDDEALPGREPDPDLAVLLTQVLQARATLYGPDPADVFDPVPDADLVRAMTDAIPGIEANLHEDPIHGLLALARIWRTLATGDIVRKDEAAVWAGAQLAPGHRPVLSRARDLYLGGGGPSAPVDLATVEAAGREMARQAGAAAARSAKGLRAGTPRSA